MMSLLKKPSAWIPLVLSLAALGLVIGHVALFGVTRNADEGTAARIFQFLFVVQLPFILYFAITWLPKKPKYALVILLLQAIAGLIAWIPIFILERPGL